METIQLRSGEVVLVDDDDYQTFGDEDWRECGGRYIYADVDGQRWYLHRAILNAPEGTYVSFLDKNYRNCRKDNLYFYDPERPGSRLEARKKKLQELHEKGVDVSRYTQRYVPEPKFKIVDKVEHPDIFDSPVGAPPDVRAIQTRQGTLVFVDAADFPHLVGDDWRDSGRAILRTARGGPERLARMVANSYPDELVGYYDGIYRHCWRDNLFYYFRRKRKDGMIESTNPKNRRLPAWAMMEERD